MAIPVRLIRGCTANRLVREVIRLVERNQGRHVIVLAVDTLRVVSEDRLRDDVCRGHQRIDNRRILRERTTLCHKGGKAVEVKLDIGEGIAVGQEQLAERLHIGTEAGICKSKNIAALACCVVILHNEVVVHAADRQAIKQSGVLRVAEED